MPSRERLRNSATGNPQELLKIWREERSIRVGRTLCYSGILLAALATVFDYLWSGFYVVLTDLILLAGCIVSASWIRAKSRPVYYWWPLYWGFWISILPSLWSTGGIGSPFFGVDLAALCVIGVVMESRDRAWAYLLFTFLHIPVFYFIEKFYPLMPAGAPPADLTAAITAVTLTAVFLCLHALLRTENELASEFAAYYRTLAETEENLKTSEAQLREAQSIARIGSWEWDMKADRISWSDELHRIFGVPKEGFDPSYQAYLQRLSPAMRERIDALVKRSIESGEDYVLEHQLERPEGTRHIWSRGRIVRDASGTPVKLLGTAQDITDRKRIESELLEARTELERRVEERTLQLAQSLEREKSAKEIAESASQAKMQFLANMSHEIRTPMNSILGFSELLSSEEHSPEKTREYISRIRVNGKQLLHLIDDILDLSKFEAGRIPIRKAPVAVRPLFDDVTQSFMPTLKSKGLDLHVGYHGEFKGALLADAHRLSQILINLLGNSIKFSESGTVRIDVRESVLEGDRVLLRVDVIDAGIGISAENQGRLFQPFSQADGSIARKFGGSGLGLALSRRIAEAMGGRLELEASAPGRGSHFMFEIPAELAPADAREPAVAKPMPSTSTLVDKRILLVEDSPDNALLITHYVRALGVEVDHATDGVQAVAAAVSKHYHCILMDIQMPGMDGLEATRRIRALGYRNPIIALTAHALPTEASRSLEAGCTLHLTKPITKAELVGTLTEQLRSLDL